MRRLPAGPLTAIRTLALAWSWLALLWLAASRLAQWPPWLWIATVLVLAALPAWGLWLAAMIRKRVRHLQFAAQGWLRRWFSGGLWPAIKAAGMALPLVAAALWQAYFLAPAEWFLLALAPGLYLALLHGMNRLLAPQFAQPAFAWAAAQRASRWLFTILLGLSWLALMLHGALDARLAHPAMTPDMLDQAIAKIAAAPSGLVRWGLDGLLALQVTGGAIRDLPQAPTLRIVLLALSGPGVMLLALGLMLQGASGLRLPLRRAARLKPTERQSASAALIAFLAVLGLAILLSATTALELLAQQHRSPLALQRLPQCERIAGEYYTVGTTQALRQIALQALGQAQAPAHFCARMGDMTQALDAALERYLDWYFSLGAEWGRIFHLLSGSSEAFLQQHLQQTLQATPGLSPWLQAVQEQETGIATRLAASQQRVAQTLQAHHLMLDAGHCLVQAEAADLPELHMLGSARQRLATSTLAGLGAGAFAGAVAAKAMGKAGMKAAAKVLAKAAAKQGLAKSAAMAAGATLGSVLPGAGTAAGALAGAAVGALVSVGMDWTALRVEEHLTRDGMKADLQAALHEQMDDVATALGCGRRDPGGK